MYIDTFNCSNVGETYGAEDPHTGLPMRKQVWHVNHIRFSLRHMKSLGDIPLFSRITILTLDHNYLENIDALSSLKDLIKLDLHSNQVGFDLRRGLIKTGCVRVK